MSNKEFRERIREELEEIKKLGLYRKLRTVKGLNFSSNDYLALSSHPRVVKALSYSLAGATGSRLTSGNVNHEILEEEIAKFKNFPTSLIYPSGYQANLGLISSLCKKGDLILSDELNHASIIDGCRLSKADKIIYKHNDINSLYEILEKNHKNYKNIFIVTDSVFSMDGDIANLKEIKKIADEFSSVLIVDDAHATGVLGDRGRGSFEYFKIRPSDNTIVVVTFSKALGCQGGAVCCIEEVREYLINTSRAFIYSTALSPALVNAVLESLKIIKETDIVKRLKDKVEEANKILLRYKLIEERREVPIFPIILGELTMKVSEELIKNNIFCVGIRYPTVPKGKERIRVSITLNHKKEDIELLAKKMKESILKFSS
ncbi:8-amino-7-oxononanoate synthase [Methanocaldococcus infernus ME]|uniref:8-amino-7-oxononanoate synthase n=1 Tax=Methanocaldococcus infernus (strain DSM 11812 / JCM 15783 / ME) TaxID=573063 RepID=D5VTZ8_METIM|nr:aminotransferase class I/II-fold pyridoxal phosphate-dependent enzyme [Methanocaldococcus infernus]ADG14051.1 8-amino-7-oxononanoate synthase [Methanocaldococcus infernus ME]